MDVSRDMRNAVMSTLLVPRAPDTAARRKSISSIDRGPGWLPTPRRCRQRALLLRLPSNRSGARGLIAALSLGAAPPGAAPLGKELDATRSCPSVSGSVIMYLDRDLTERGCRHEKSDSGTVRGACPGAPGSVRGSGAAERRLVP